MKQEDVKRLEELQSENYLSDDEYDELEMLKEKQKAENNEPEPEQKATNQNTQRKKRSLFEVIKERLKEKPATWDEIQQLKLDKQKAILKRDISMIKSQTPSKLDLMMNKLEALNGTGQQRGNKKHSDNFKRTSDNLRKIVGNNDKEKFKGLTGHDSRYDALIGNNNSKKIRL